MVFAKFLDVIFWIGLEPWCSKRNLKFVIMDVVFREKSTMQELVSVVFSSYFLISSQGTATYKKSQLTF